MSSELEGVKGSSFDFEKQSQEQLHDGAALTADVSCLFLSLSLSLQRWIVHLSNNRTELQVSFDDPNFDPETIPLEDESPYPEVRSAVANTDDPTIPASTLRAWAIGLVLTIVIPGMNQFFYFRYPSVSISLVCLPLFFCYFSSCALLC
jgi:hypothetical protein